jgi:hypothetical protein
MSIYSSFLSVVKSIVSFVSVPTLYAFIELPNNLTFLPKALTSSLFVYLPANFALPVKLSVGYNTEVVGTAYNSSTLSYTNFSVNSPMSFSDNSTS